MLHERNLVIRIQMENVEQNTFSFPFIPSLEQYYIHTKIVANPNIKLSSFFPS